MTRLARAAVIGGTILVANWVAPAVVKIVHRRSFLRRVAGSGAVHLTFDDGPDPASTPAILDLLAERQVRAAFFVIGRRAAEHPDIVTRIQREGHQVGSHGQAHTHAWKTSPWATAADLHRADEQVRCLLDGEARSELWFRPPFGKLNLGSLPFLSDRTAWWSVDPRDYECRSASQVFDRLVGELRPGAVVLLHDARPQGSAAVTVDTVRMILDHGHAHGLRFEPLPTPSRQ